MKEQLTLIDTERNWRIDEKTKIIGFRGIEQAREALASARRPAPGLDRAA